MTWFLRYCNASAICLMRERLDAPHKSPHDAPPRCWLSPGDWWGEHTSVLPGACDRCGCDGQVPNPAPGFTQTGRLVNELGGSRTSARATTSAQGDPSPPLGLYTPLVANHLWLWLQKLLKGVGSSHPCMSPKTRRVDSVLSWHPGHPALQENSRELTSKCHD